MASLLSGSKELVYIKTDKVSITIKGIPSHPKFQNSESDSECSELKILCKEPFSGILKESSDFKNDKILNEKFSYCTSTIPIFYEQQAYEIIVESNSANCEFWHENLNIRKQVKKLNHNSNILLGSLNFGNEIGYSDLIIRINGTEYLRIIIEVFPSKIEYKNDYQAIITDVANEVFKVIFDFNKKTYEKFGSNLNSKSTLTEFYTLINFFYDDYIKAVDVITNKPHHLLETQYNVTPSYKAKRTDSKSIKWPQKHPEQIKRVQDNYKINKVLSSKKIVSFDIKENQFVKYILLSTKKRLELFRANYLLLNRDIDSKILENIDSKISGINRRLNNSFLKDVAHFEKSFGMSLVFSMAIGYRDLYKYYLKLIHGLSFLDDIFNTSVKDLADLYEYWCFIKLNSILRDKYKLLSRDYLKVNTHGIFYSLKKGQESKVKYINPSNGENITLSYNPKSIVPTSAQKPDNVLSIEKRVASSKQEYKYVFDAKYRINPALPGTSYKESYNSPGPQEDSINTMHRYRDAIVFETKSDETFKRSMFGAYVLFPYGNEKEYISHNFYKSINKVNVGGLPFLPSATTLVSNFIDELISDSPDAAFERSTLPAGIEEKLSKVDWNKRDVLIGELKDREQYDLCKNKRFYHFPASQISDSQLPIHYVAIYKSKQLFGEESGIYEYGEVIRCYKLPRNKITQRPSTRTDEYYVLEVKDWKTIEKIDVKQFALRKVFFTNMFLLQNSSIYPELFLKNELEYRLYSELKYHMNNATPDEKEIGFSYKGARITFENGEICIYKDGKIKSPVFTEEEFMNHPRTVFNSILTKI